MSVELYGFQETLLELHTDDCDSVGSTNAWRTGETEALAGRQISHFLTAPEDSLYSSSRSWHEVRVTLSGGSAGPISFEGVRGASYQGDIAIDDISVTPGVCVSIVKQCFNAECSQIC